MMKSYPPPPFERQRDSAASSAHDVNLDRCIEHHEKHPDRWQWLCKAAEYAVKKNGAKHGSIAGIVEDYRRYARDPRNADARAAEFKISNTDRAYFARALEDAGIVPVGFFKFKKQPSKTRTASDEQTPSTVEPDPTRTNRTHDHDDDGVPP